jgi:hypothetical protein
MISDSNQLSIKCRRSDPVKSPVGMRGIIKSRSLPFVQNRFGGAINY